MKAPTNSPKKSQQGRVFSAVVNYGLGGMAPKIVNFLLLPLYTVYVDPASFGKLEIFFGAQLFLVTLMRGGMPSAVARLFFDDRGEEVFGDLVWTCVVAATGTIVVGSAVFVTVFPLVAVRFFQLGELWPWLWLVVIAAAGQIYGEFLRRLLQAREESSMAAKLGASQAILTTILSLTFVVGFDMNALGIMLGATTSTALFGLVGVAYLRRYFSSRFRWTLLKEAVAYAGPLVPHHFFAAVHQHAGRWMVASAASVTVTGYLAFAGRLTSPLMMLIGAFSAAYSPVYFAWRSKMPVDQVRTEVSRVGTSLTSIGALLVLAISLGGVLVVRHAVADTYAPAVFLIAGLAFANYLQLVYTFVVAELFFSKQTKLIPTIFLITASTNVTALLVLVPRYEGAGAVGAQIIGTVVSLLLTWRYARRTFPIPLSLRALAAACAAIVGVAAFPYVWPELGLVIDTVVAAGAFVVVGTVMLLGAGSTRAVLRDAAWILTRVKGRLRS